MALRIGRNSNGKLEISFRPRMSSQAHYEMVLQEMHDKYHIHPTALNNGPVTPEQRESQSYRDAQGRHEAKLRFERGWNSESGGTVHTAAGDRPFNSGKDVV